MTRPELDNSINTVFDDNRPNESLNPSLAGAELKKVADYVDQENNKKVDKVDGKSLILNTEIARLLTITAIFTTALKTVYDNAVTWISTNGANVLTHINNLSTNITTDGTSDVKYPSVKAVKTYVDANTIDTAFVAKTYTSTMSIPYDTDSPNIEITLSGNLNLTVTGTSNGDFGIVNIYSSASETIIVNGLKGLSLTGNGSSQMIPISFVHSTDGIRWYDERESIGSDIDTANLAESVGTTLWHPNIATSTGTVTSSGTNWTGTGTALTGQMVGAKIFIGSESLIIDTINTGAQTFTTTEALPTDVTNSAFQIKLVAQKNVVGTIRWYDANEGSERGTFESGGDFVFNGLRMRSNNTIVSSASLFIQENSEIHGNRFSSPFLAHKNTFLASQLPILSTTDRYIASVSDADTPTYHGILNGGGNVNCIVYWNGLNWIT